MGKFLDWLSSRTSLAQTLWQLAIALGAGSLMSWAAQASAWIDKYGPITWVLMFAIGAYLGIIGLRLFAMARLKIAQATLARKFASDSAVTINPLDTKFDQKRFDLDIFHHPIERIVKLKSFTDCQILGPGALIFSNNNVLSAPNFIDCDFVMTANELRVNSAVVFEDCHFIRCQFYRALVLVPESEVSPFSSGSAGIKWLNPQKQLSLQQLPSTEQKTQP